LTAWCHQALAFGCHALEVEAGRRWRWIDDAAFIAVAAPRNLEIDLHALLPVPDQDPWRLSAAYRVLSASLASVPYVGSRRLAPPLSPAKQPPAVWARLS
jgi:hypothetical protein